MQELTGVALLAEPAQPVLAYRRETFAVPGVCRELFGGLEVLGGGAGVAEGAEGGTEGTAGLGEVEAAYLFIYERERKRYKYIVQFIGRMDRPLSSLMPSSCLMKSSSGKLFW